MSFGSKPAQDPYGEFKDELVHSTILDKEVLDSLISKCILTMDDREEIDTYPDQSSRNQKLLDILMYRPYHTFPVFVEVMKESEQRSATLLERMTKVLDNGAFEQFKDELINSSILDKEVMDSLISKCILTVDDKEEINQFLDQPSRNQKLLEILILRPHTVFNIFVGVMKESDQQCNILLKKMTKFFDKDVTLQNELHKDEMTGIEANAVKLIKCYKTIVHNVDVDAAGILDQLLSKMVISSEDNEEIRLQKNTTQEKNRRLLGKILRKTDAYETFLKILKKDSCYGELSTNIENTAITQNDFDLLSIGRRFRERKRNGMTDTMIESIQNWERDDSIYIKTRATNHVIACINKHSCVSVLGPSGCGKTALVRHVALQMETNGYTIICVTNAGEIEKCYKMNRKTLFIVDDMCGNFTANQSRLEEWKKAIKNIEIILKNENCKLILTCRLQVFQDKGFRILRVFKTCECNLSSGGLSLTTEEKEKMTSVYFGVHASKAMIHLGEYDFLPLICKLYYGQKTNLQSKLDLFLNDPFSFYQDNLTDMYNDCKEGKYKYCALLLVVIFNNKLIEKDLTGKDSQVQGIIEDAIDACEIDENITGKTLNTQLDILIGTFVTYEENIYRTIHDKMFDFLAVYFGTQHVDVLIRHATVPFLQERFLVIEKNETYDTEYASYLIPVHEENIEMYIKRIFNDLEGSSDVNQYIRGNTNLQEEKFHAMFLDYMKSLNRNEIEDLIKTSNSEFLNRMFVVQENDIKNEVASKRMHAYQRYGIVIPAAILQQYTEKWFDHFTNTNDVNDYVDECRSLRNAGYHTVMWSYIKQLNTDKMASVIETCSQDFIIRMFVMTENDIHHVKDDIYHHYTCFSIVIPDELLQQYIQRLFDVLTKPSFDMDDLLENIPLMRVSFRRAVRTHMRQLARETTALIIQTAEEDFFNTMFIMTEEDIKDNVENRHECFCIMIPDDLLKQYIQRLFDVLTEPCFDMEDFPENRPSMNVSFRSAVRTHMRQLAKETVAAIIQTAGYDFFNTMFVMTEEDIIDNAENRHECFCIVIPDDLLQQYIQRLFGVLTEPYFDMNDFPENRPSMNESFRRAVRTHMRQLANETVAAIIQTAGYDFFNTMFAMSEDDINDNAENRHECFCILIPDDMLQNYIDRWLKDSIDSYSLESAIARNKPMVNLSFCNAVRTNMRQLSTEKITSIIQTAKNDFFNMMFVMTEEDIKENAEKKYERFGIVIPGDLLQQYIERWFNSVKKANSVTMVKECMDDNRPLRNVTFRTAVREFIRQLDTEKIALIIDTAGDDFLNTMCVMTEDDIRENAENNYESFGCIIPEDLLQKYIERWINSVKSADSVKECMDVNRPLMNVKFRSAVRNYMRQLDKEKIAFIIDTYNDDFLNTMFVMKEEDIKDNSENTYECFGIVITDDLIQKYIKSWLSKVSCANSVNVYINANRLSMDVSFRTVFRTYLSQLDKEEIRILIQTGGVDFLNTMFVMTEEDMKDHAENKYECFSIALPEHLLQLYIKRWFKSVKKADSVKECMDVNRPLTNAKFRSAVRNYMRQIGTEKIASIIATAKADFLTTMFVAKEEDIRDNAVNYNECFGIVITDDLIQQYIKSWLANISCVNSVKDFMNDNRPLMDNSFRTAFRTYLSQLDKEKIRKLILLGNVEFLNTMFVMTCDDIRDNAANRYETFGIVISDDMYVFQQYIERWFECLTEANSVKECMNANRSVLDVSFRTALRTYIIQLGKEEIETIIQTGSSDFLNTMFVLTDNEIVEDNDDYQFECFGIVIPGDMLDEYITRWIDCMTKADAVMEFVRVNRSSMNILLQSLLEAYMN